MKNHTMELQKVNDVGELIEGTEIEVEFEFHSEPAERATRDYPGDPGGITLEGAYIPTKDGIVDMWDELFNDDSPYVFIGIRSLEDIAPTVELVEDYVTMLLSDGYFYSP